MCTLEPQASGSISQLKFFRLGAQSVCLTCTVSSRYLAPSAGQGTKTSGKRAAQYCRMRLRASLPVHADNSNASCSAGVDTASVLHNCFLVGARAITVSTLCSCKQRMVRRAQS